MTSHVPAGGCHFELRHFTVHIFFFKTWVATMGMKHVDPGSVSAMLYGAQWVTQNHKYLLSNSNIFTISATEEGSKAFVFVFFLFLRMNRLYRSEDVLPLLLLIYTELVFCSNNDRSSQYTHDHWLTATDALRSLTFVFLPLWIEHIVFVQSKSSTLLCGYAKDRTVKGRCHNVRYLKKKRKTLGQKHTWTSSSLVKIWQEYA